MAIEIVNEIAPNAEDWEIIKQLNLLYTNTEILYRNFNLLSGGEQVKNLLISLFLKGNNFLLIDEPTNHLDNETRNNIVDYLKKKKGFILVSYDRNFLYKVVNHIISINFQIKYKDKTIFNPISFEVNNGDRVVIMGKNGIEKSQKDFDTNIQDMSEGQKKRTN